MLADLLVRKVRYQIRLLAALNGLRIVNVGRTRKLLKQEDLINADLLRKR